VTFSVEILFLWTWENRSQNSDFEGLKQYGGLTESILLQGGLGGPKNGGYFAIRRTSDREMSIFLQVSYRFL